LVGTGNSGNGGDILGIAGTTSAASKKGGGVTFIGGDGTSTSSSNGGDGGDVTLRGGQGFGRNSILDVGGYIKMFGGTSAYASGGSIIMSSGVFTLPQSNSVLRNALFR
jgi:hypothetical protein